MDMKLKENSYQLDWCLQAHFAMYRIKPNQLIVDLYFNQFSPGELYFALFSEMYADSLLLQNGERMASSAAPTCNRPATLSTAVLRVDVTYAKGP